MSLIFESAKQINGNHFYIFLLLDYVQGPGFNSLGGDVQTIRRQPHFCAGGKCAPMMNSPPLSLHRISGGARNAIRNKPNGGLVNTFQNVPGIGFVPSSNGGIGLAQTGRGRFRQPGDIKNTLMNNPSGPRVGNQVSL